MASGVVGLLDGFIETQLWQIQRTRLSELASSTIIVYDHLITLDQEINLIWRAPWTPGKCLFLANRYYLLFVVAFNNYVLFSSNLNSSFCNVWFKWQGWTGLGVCMVAEVLLQLRLYALYYLNRTVLAIMFTAFVAASASAATILGVALSKITAIWVPPTIPGYSACVPNRVPNWFYAFWIPTLGFESLLCAMALYRGFENFKGRDSMFQSGRKIVKIIIRDSIVYFLFIFAVYLANLIVFLGAGSHEGELETGIGFAVAVSGIMASRLSLNIRDVQHEIEETSLSQTNQSSSRVGLSRKSSYNTTGGRRGTVHFHDPSDTHATISQGSRGEIIVSSSYALTDFEMVELRNMRAEESRVGLAR